MPKIEFKTSEQKEQSFDPIPAGKYKAVITECEDKATKSGDGNYYNFKFQIIEGPHANRTVFHMANYNNPNPQAQAIGRGQLATIAKAAGKVDPSDTDELLNLPMLITVAIKAGNDGYPPKNEIKKWEPTTAAAPTDTANSKAPWKK